MLKPFQTKWPELVPQVFIGYDDRQPKAYEVCKQSILHNASGPVDIYPLEHRDLRRKGLFWREWGVDVKTGTYYDKLDGIPFSNQFSHTRFLVPHYCDYLGIEQRYALFVDLDFVFFDDIYKLFAECTGKHDVYCVKHEYHPDAKEKMDHQVQSKYPKKLWSSLMIFDNAFRGLTPEYVNTAKSSSLHRFEWTKDELIGTLPESWNFIPNHSENRVDKIQAIHYTEGLPNLQGYETSKFARYYLDLERKL